MNQNSVIQLIFRWGVVFLVLGAAIWAATQSQAAPQLILLALLYVITINFSLPFAWGAVGLVPVVSVSSLIVVGWETAVSLFFISFLLAQLTQTLWQPLWESLGIERPSWASRLATCLVYVLPLSAAGVVYQFAGGVAPIQASMTLQLLPLLELSLSYGLIYLGVVMGLWMSRKRPFPTFLHNHALYIAGVGFLATPFAALGGLSLAHTGLPSFVIFCLGIAVFTILSWLSWQRRFILEQQLTQMTALNTAGESWREVFDLPTVLERTHQQISDLIPLDSFAIYLQETPNSPPQSPISHLQSPNLSLDDFTQWVMENGRLLDIDGRNLHFASQHNLKPPVANLSAWLGIPLIVRDNLIGVMVLQRLQPRPPFSRWSREVLFTIAAQVSIAIENTHLHRQLIQQRLAEQEADLTRMMVHDLRNPLTTLISMLDMLSASGQETEGSVSSTIDNSPFTIDNSPPKQPKVIHPLIEDARQVCFDMLDMVDSLMDMTRLEAGKLVVEAEAMRLPPLAERIIGRLKTLSTQRDIDLSFETISPGLPAIWADEEIMRRVLINLLDNALKFTPAGGRVLGRFQTEPPMDDRHEPGVRCIISDSGPGIAPEFRERIFDRYVQTNQGGVQVRGTGLGLAFCKLAIEAQNGRIWVEDEPTGGSRFIFTLPGMPIF